MRSIALVMIAAFAVALVAGAALAKPKPKGTAITERDVQTCLGANGSTPEDQVIACTKLLNSGKIKHPHEGDYYATRSAAYFSMKQHDKALADLNKALTFRQVPEIYFQRALLHIAMGNSALAKADLAQVMKVKPEFAPGFFMSGLIAYDEGAYKEAVTFFDGAVQRLPTYYQALYARGAAKKKAGDEDGGAKDIKDAKGMSSHVESDMAKLGFKS